MKFPPAEFEFVALEKLRGSDSALVLSDSFATPFWNSFRSTLTRDATFDARSDRACKLNRILYPFLVFPRFRNGSNCAVKHSSYD